MPTPFSMIGAASSKPTAVGESGYHLPMMPFLSGQEAVDSLLGYYPQRRMDSKLNPHTYQRPNSVRSTTMPNTKVATLRRNYLAIKLAALDLTRSGLVRGFIEKCAKADLDPEATYQAVCNAMHVHPEISAEFQKCGMDKQSQPATPARRPPPMSMPSRASLPTGKFPTPAPTPQAQQPRLQPQPPRPRPQPQSSQYPPGYTPPPQRSTLGQGRASLMTGKLPTPAPVSALPPRPRLQPQTQPQQSQPATPARQPPQRYQQPAAGVTAASDENMFTAPFNAVGELFSSGPVAQHFFGFSRRNAEGDYVPNVSAASEPGPALGERFGSVGRSALAGPGLVGAVPMDVLRGATGDGWNMDYTKMMTRDFMDGFNTNFRTNIGHDVKARPAGMEHTNGMYIGPDEGRQFFGNTYNPSTGEESLSATQAVAKHMLAESKRPNAEGGTAIKRIVNSTLHPVMANAEPILGTLMATKLPYVKDIPGLTGLASATRYIPMAGAFQGAYNEIGPKSAINEGHRVDETNKMRAADSSTIADVMQKRQAGLIGEPEIGSMFSNMENFAKQAPEQAKDFFNQSVSHLKGLLDDPEAQAEIKAAEQSGQLGPAGEQGSLTALTNEGMNWDRAKEIHAKMDTWDKIGLWGGIGIAGLGLIHAMTGGGGIASVLMALLGLGTTGFMAGKSGLLDQGSQDFTQGITDAVTGGESPQLPEMVKAQMPRLLSMPDNILIQSLQQLEHLSPDAAKQLDQAAGVGSWGNSALGWLGDMTGMRQSKMQQSLGLDPQQQDRLLKLWTQMRGQ